MCFLVLFLLLFFKGTAVVLVLLWLKFLVNNTRFPFPQQLSQLPQSTESEAGGWGGESYKEIRESLTSLGRSMGCFTRKMEEDSNLFNLICSHTPREAGNLLLPLLWAIIPLWLSYVGRCWLWALTCFRKLKENWLVNSWIVWWQCLCCCLVDVPLFLGCQVKIFSVLLQTMYWWVLSNHELV